MEKNNKGLVIVVFILFVMAAFGAGYILSDSSKEKENNNNNNNGNTNVVENKTVDNNTNTSNESKKSQYVKKSNDYFTEEEEESLYSSDLDENEFLSNKSKMVLVLQKGDYEVYNTNCSKVQNDFCKDKYDNKMGNTDKYYVYDTKKNKGYSAMSVDDYENGPSKYIFNFITMDPDEGDDTIGIFDLRNKNIITGYEEYSCAFHSDATIEVCYKEETTIVRNNKKFGVVSLKDGSVIIDLLYDMMYEDDNFNFIVKKGDKFGVLSDTGKVLLNVEYDYIGYSSYFGYLAIKGDNIELYNNDMIKQTIDSNTLDNLYQTSLDKYNGELLKAYTDINDYSKPTHVNLANADSYYWSSGSVFVKQDVSAKFYDESTDEKSDYRFKYTGSKYSGEKLIIFSVYEGCSGNPIMYVIDNNKAYKVDKKEIELPKDKEGNYRAFCF